MRSLGRPISSVLLLIAAALAGCGGADVPDARAESFVLYSIDGRFGTKEKALEGGELLRGFPVLGKLDVSDATTRAELVAAFKEGIARSDGEVAKCFWPRHAIRTTRGGEVVDYIICFECLQYLVYRGEGSSGEKPIDDSPLKTFNEVLKRANVPLAPSALKSAQ